MLYDCSLQVHTPPDDQDKSFESPSGLTPGFLGQFNDWTLECGREQHISKIFATTALFLFLLSSMCTKKLDNLADHHILLASFNPRVSIEGRARSTVAGGPEQHRHAQGGSHTHFCESSSSSRLSHGHPIRSSSVSSLPHVAKW